MTSIDPDSEENQAATRQHEREVFALQMQAKQDVSITDDELRIAIAAATGEWSFKPNEDWVEIFEDGKLRMRFYPAHSSEQIVECLDMAGVPDYIDSLDAMFSAEETLLVGDGAAWNEYARALDNICAKHGDDPRHACSYQRAQAFVRTIAVRAQREVKP